MKQKLHIQTVLHEIESNLANEFNIDKIAHLGYVSPMQLYRDFYNLTGHSVKEYIRRRRLSSALSLVKHSDMSLTDIAYTCGYSSQQAFCRCVKSATGQTPLEYKESDNYYYFPMFNRDNKLMVTVTTETIPQTLCIKFYHSQFRGIENRAVNYLLTVLPEYNGRIFGRNGSQLESRLCYELYIEPGDKIFEQLKGFDFVIGDVAPEITTAVAKTITKNIDEEINSSWDYLYIDWLRTSMFEQSDIPYIEEYRYRDSLVKRLVLYLPVKKRNDYNKIRLISCSDMIFLVSCKTGINAEEHSSEEVMEFLSDHYPYLIKTIHQFYVSKNGMECTCGVRLEKGFPLLPDNEMQLLHFLGGNYAILEADCCGDSSVFEDILLSWIKDSGFIRDDFVPIFTIYETYGGFENENIKTKIYIKLKKY